MCGALRVKFARKRGRNTFDCQEHCTAGATEGHKLGLKDKETMAGLLANATLSGREA